MNQTIIIIQEVVMKRILILLFTLFTLLFLISCNDRTNSIKGNPMVLYHARPGSLFNYRYLRLLENLNNVIPYHSDKDMASIKSSSSCVKSIRLIDYKTFMDDSGFMTTIKDTPVKVAVLDSSLAQLWKLAGGSLDITVKETISQEHTTNTDVTLIDQDHKNYVDYELLIAKHPDLVILNSDNEEHIKVASILRMYDIPVLAFHIDSFLEYLSTLSKFTEILDTPENYEEYGSKLLDQVEAILDKTEGFSESPSVLIIPSKNQEESIELVYHVLQELGALPTISDCIAASSSNDQPDAQVTDFTVDLQQKEFTDLCNNISNQKWALIYDGLAKLLYGETYEQ